MAQIGLTGFKKIKQDTKLSEQRDEHVWEDTGEGIQNTVEAILKESNNYYLKFVNYQEINEIWLTEVHSLKQRVALQNEQ